MVIVERPDRRAEDGQQVRFSGIDAIEILARRIDVADREAAAFERGVPHAEVLEAEMADCEDRAQIKSILWYEIVQVDMQSIGKRAPKGHIAFAFALFQFGNPRAIAANDFGQRLLAKTSILPPYLERVLTFHQSIHQFDWKVFLSGIAPFLSRHCGANIVIVLGRFRQPLEFFSR